MRYTSIISGEETYKIRFTYGALLTLEEEFGIDPSNVDELMSTKIFSTLNKLFYAGLLWERPELTLKGTSDLLDQLMEEGVELSDIISKTADALRLALQSKQPQDHKKSTSKSKAVKKN